VVPGPAKIGRDRSGAPSDSNSCRNSVFVAAEAHSAVQSRISMALLVPVTAAVAVNELVLHASSHVQKMMIICLPFARLTVPDVSSLVVTTSLLCGPPLHSWEPLKYVKSWLASNRRPADSTQCPERSTGNSSAIMLYERIKSLWQVAWMQTLN